MANAFSVDRNGRAEPLARVRCRNEDRELQRLLAKNPGLLPGDQIRPEDPRRWLLVGRELPVPDPSSGADRWSIDHVLVDQDAVPTLVECKRFSDSRARREIVGQMLEYAANGHHYWEADLLREVATETARGSGGTLDEAVADLRPTEDLSPDELFAAVVENLRSGRIRLVFFLDEAPFELRSIVDFLNGQMEKAEILLVEVHQYEVDGRRIVIPSLFGFTEEARRVKRSAPGAAPRRQWTAETFLEDARSRISQEQLRSVERLLSFAQEQGWRVGWGRGQARGSFSVTVPDICRRSILTAKSDGRIVWNFGYFNDDDAQRGFRSELAERIALDLNYEMQSELDGFYPSVQIEAWADHVGTLETLLAEVVESHRKPVQPPDRADDH